MEDSFAIKNLRTGDLILFDSLSEGLLYYFDKLIKYFTNSKFNHIGMVVKDPTFTDKQLKGLYLCKLYHSIKISCFYFSSAESESLSMSFLFLNFFSSQL